MSRRRQTQYRWLLILLVGVGLVGLDYAVRQAYKFLFIPPRVVSHPHRVPNELYHHGIRPMTTNQDIFGPYACQFYSNSLGMKDRENRDVPLQKIGPRVLFMGDSFTEGISIAWENTFVGIVADTLRPEGVEVLNGGTISYCPLLIKIRLKYLLEELGLQVDRVVVSVDTSDVLNELQYREENGRAVELPYAPFEARAEEIARVQAANKWLEKNIENNFVIIGALSRNLRLWWRSREKEIGIADYDQIPRWAWNWPDYRGPFEPYIERGLRSALKNMDEIADLLSRRGIKLTVMVYPWPHQLRHLGKTGRAETVWGDWARRHGADFINLYPYFAKAGSPEETEKKYYWKGDVHWSEEGQRFAAELLLAHFRPAILP